jgi:hypothetical protein
MADAIPETADVVAEKADALEMGDATEKADAAEMGDALETLASNVEA